MKFDKLHILSSKEIDVDYFEPMLISADAKAERRELTEYLTDAFLYFFSVFEVHKQYQSMLEKALYEQLLADKLSEAVSQVTGIDSYMSDHIRKTAREVVDTTIKHVGQNKNQNGIPETISNPKTQNPQPLSTKNTDSALHINASEKDGLSDSPLSFFAGNSSETDQDTGKELVSKEDDEVEDITESEAVAEYWLSINRARLIAQNEANAFLNYNDFVDAKKRGCEKKTWLTMEDNKVRMTHEEVEGQTIGIDETFQVGTSEMRFPLDDMYAPDPTEVVNCRCSVDYK